MDQLYLVGVRILQHLASPDAPTGSVVFGILAADLPCRIAMAEEETLDSQRLKQNSG